MNLLHVFLWVGLVAQSPAQAQSVREVQELLALQQTACPLQIAVEGGLVQSQLFFHCRQRFGGGCFAQNDLCRIAGQPFQHPEHHDRGNRQRDEKTEQALEHK